MPTLRIEFVPIQKFALGWFGFDHLQLAYEPDEIPMVPNPQDDWYILEGDSESTDHGAFLGVIGESGDLTMAVANLAYGQDLVDKIGTPNDRGSRILTPNTVSVSNAWIAMASYGAEIQLNDFPYLAYGAPYSPYPTFNSSSVIASLLWQIGIDVNSVMPYGVRVSPGTSTLLGTEHNDVMSMPTANFDTLAGGYGNDVLNGTNVWYRVDKMYGGAGNDIFNWSTGFNIINGGDPVLQRDQDGYDRVNYEGAGTIIIKNRKGNIRGLSPDYIVTFTGLGDGGGTDWLYSIESVLWDSRSDTLIFGPGVTGIPEDLNIDMGNENSAEGDTADFSQSQSGIVMRASSEDQVHISLENGEGSSRSWWMSNMESIVGSEQDDELHLDTTITSAEGGAGNDIIDSRNVTPGTGASPGGYDVELDGGIGQDTLIAGVGRTLAKGGGGTDIFILAALSENGHLTELTIEDASTTDRLFIPLNFFNGSIGSADNSLLLPILGGIGDWSIMDANLAGSFIHQTTEQFVGDDETAGIIPFTGEILFYRHGTDLLISIVPGRPATRIVEIEGIPTYTVIYAELDYSRETFVRVRNFEPGMLGITFESWIIDEEFRFDAHGLVYADYLNRNEIANRVTAGGSFTMILPPNPIGPPPPTPSEQSRVQIDGTSTNDTIDLTNNSTPQVAAGAQILIMVGDGNDTVMTGASADTVNGGSGDDIITTGAGEDILDGGAGTDVMSGGSDDDTYFVDNAGDIIIETTRQGRDTVVSSVNYALGANLEDLTLTGIAAQGAGNGGRNTLIGNDADNVLDGGAGDDTLYGGNGDDILIGGTGHDAYVYFASTGHKTIIDTGPSSDIDTLVLDGGIEPGDIRAYRLTSAPNDLMIGFTFGGWVNLVGQLTGSGVEEIMFSDGTIWTRADIDALEAPLLGFPPPEAIDDGNILIFGTQATIPSLAVLGNDQSFDGNLSIVAINDVSTGSVTLDTDGNLVVSAPDGFTGYLTFNYTVLDGHGEIATATATIYVDEPLPAPVNAAPTATADSIASSYRNIAITLNPTTLLANDTDPDGNPLTIVSVGDATHGQVIQQPGGAIVSTPATDFVGTASFSYTVSDGNGGTAIATVTLTILAPPAVTLQGSNGNDNLLGGAGDDTLNGQGGQDVVNGGLGSDTMSGGDQNDVYYVDHIGDQVLETNANQTSGGFDIVHATIDYTLTANVEQLELEGAASYGTGNSLNNVLYGLNATQQLWLDGREGDDVLYGSLMGANTLIGGTGKDTLIAAGGNNTLIGGDGNDTYIITAATDLVIEDNANQASGGFDIVRSTINTTLTANVEQLMLEGGAVTTGTGNDGNNVLHGLGASQALTLDGGLGNDTLYGSLAGGNTLIGGAGEDKLFARGNANTLVGGSNNDSYYSESATDTIIEASASGFDTLYVNYAVSTLAANVEQMILQNNAVSATANSLDNYMSSTATHGVTMDGGAGSDVINGTAYDDILIGGLGNDQLDLRKGGQDTLRYANAGFGRDTVLGFDATASASRDLIDLTGRGFTATSLGSSILVTASGSDTLISIGTDQIRLTGIAPSLITAASFRF